MSIKKISDKKSTVIKTVAGSLFSIAGIYLAMGHAGFTYGFYWYTLFFILIPFILIAQNDLFRLATSDGAESSKIFRYSFIFGLLFGICLDMGYQLQKSDLTLPGLKGKLIIVFTGICLSVLLLPLTYRLFRLVSGLYEFKKKSEASKSGCRKVFFISLGVMLVFWIPVFLSFYPAVMSYDFNRQSQEAMRGFIWFYDYQPLAHTFLIRQFLLLGSRLGDLGLGMAWYSVFQSLILASAISAGLVFVYKRSGVLPVILWTAFFALLPFNPVLAISVTKDIIFSAFFLLVILLVYRMDEGAKGCSVYVMLVLCGIVNILFRNNARYALLFLIPAFMITGRTVGKKLMLSAVTLVMIVCGICSKTMIVEGMNAIHGSRMEMYSVPIMQMFRVVHYQEANLTDEQTQILHRYIAPESWGKYYPYISDGFKAGVNEEAWYGDQIALLKDYLKIGLAYPNDYLDAFLDLTAGYWFIDDKTHAEMLEVGDDTGLGLIYTFNGSKSEVLPEGIASKEYVPGLHGIYCHILNGNSYYDWPVISVLFKPALYFWILMYALFAGIYRRNKRFIPVLAYPVFYMLTMLLGPCVNFRYVYPFIVSAPVFIAMAFHEKKPEE